MFWEVKKLEDLETLQDEFQETMEELRKKIKDWEEKIWELEEFKNSLSKDLVQVSDSKGGINKETINKLTSLKKELEEQKGLTRGLQKKWEVLLFLQLVLILALIFSF